MISNERLTHLKQLEAESMHYERSCSRVFKSSYAI